MSSPERDEELFSLQAIYCDTFNTFEVVDDAHFRFHSAPIVLSIMLPLSYPNTLQLPEISVDSQGLGVSRLQMFQLQIQLEAILQKKPGEPVLFELTEETREFTEGLRDDVRVCLEEEEEEEEWEDYHIDDSDKRVTDNTVVRSLMGSMDIETIMSKLPRSIRLLHAEIVLRTDLRKRYLDMRREIQHAAAQRIKDRRAKDVAWDKYGKEEVVFHGTLRQNVGSIVRSGFVVPGQKTVTGENVTIRCGTTWGQGIYTSPDPNYSLAYTDTTREGEVDKSNRRLLPGHKLIICSVLMGRRCNMTDTRHLGSTVEAGFDSHVSPNQLEYIVFNSAQVLPLYVLHLGNGSTNTGLPMTVDFLPHGPVHFEGNLTEHARKHLPNGFGAASGHRFIVEAIAPVDDDEELWGDYQYDQDEFQEERWPRHWGS